MKTQRAASWEHQGLGCGMICQQSIVIEGCRLVVICLPWGLERKKKEGEEGEEEEEVRFFILLFLCGLLAELVQFCFSRLWWSEGLEIGVSGRGGLGRRKIQFAGTWLGRFFFLFCGWGVWFIFRTEIFSLVCGGNRVRNSGLWGYLIQRSWVCGWWWMIDVMILSCGKIWFREGEREIRIFSKFQIFRKFYVLSFSKTAWERQREFNLWIRSKMLGL